MISSRYIFILAVLVALGVSGLSSKSVQAAEGMAEDQSLPEKQGTPPDGAGAAEPRPKSPIKLSTVDFQDTGNGSGKLTLAGVALPGNELYLFLDDEPFAKVLPDDGGKWSVEGEMKLDDGRHTFRADQYDATSEMLVARAMVSIERAKQGSGEAPAEPPPAKATAP